MDGISGINKAAPIGESEGRSELTFEVLEYLEGRLEGLVKLARVAHAESRFSYIAFAPQKVETIAQKALADTKRHGIMLCSDHGQLVGAVYCSVGEYHIGTGTLVTTIHNINVLPEKRHGLSGGKIALGLFARR